MARLITYLGMVIALVAVWHAVSMALPAESSLITGMTVSAGEGCCLLTCTQAAQQGCPAEHFRPDASCSALESCNIGCCITTEGYCLSNYPRYLCEGKPGAQGRAFIDGRECPHYWQCTKEPEPDEIRENTGYESLFMMGQKGVTFAEHFALKKGESQSFTFYAFRHPGEELANGMGVKLYDAAGAESQEFPLFNDGYHNEWEGGDELLGTVQIPMVPEVLPSLALLEGLQKVLINTTVGGSKNQEPEPYFLVSATDCIPMLGTWKERPAKSIFFVGNGHDPKASSAIIIDRLGQFTYFQGEFQQTNFYMLRQTTQAPDLQAALLEIEHQCGSLFNPSTDFVFFINSMQKGCMQQGNVIHTNATYAFDEGMLRGKGPDSLLAHYCEASYTLDELYKRAESFLLLPTISITSPAEGAVLLNQTFNVSLLIEDSHGAAYDYNITLDFADFPGSSAQGNAAIPAGRQSVSINHTIEGICNGRHELWAELSASDQAEAVSEEVNITVAEEGFLINIIDYTRRASINNGQIGFRFSHNNASASLHYQLVVYDVASDSLAAYYTAPERKAVQGETKAEFVSLPPHGEYIIRITAYDSNGLAACETIHARS